VWSGYGFVVLVLNTQTNPKDLHKDPKHIHKDLKVHLTVLEGVKNQFTYSYGPLDWFGSLGVGSKE
jgi:hypothetical protein